ncbi:MAG: SpoIIE family protein phosphatase [Bacteroidales bacterium]|nr:SpoIIE family protein phosphatase [Bacteroidales bacterium]
MVHKKNHSALFVVLLLLLFPEVISQIPFFRQVSLFRGKEDHTVNTVHQDKDGWIWFGTDNGLFRYDGINYDRYTIGDGLVEDHVTALATDSEGILWIGHKNGKISLHKQQSFSSFNPAEGLGNVEITDIVTDSAGNIWYATLGEGIFKYDGRYLSNVSTDDGLSDNYVYDIEIDRQGFLWLGTDYGVSKYSDGEISIKSMKDGLPDNIIRAINSDNEGKIWLGSQDRGISVYDPLLDTISVFDDWSFGAITGFARSLKNELWVSTARQGVVKLAFDDEGRTVSLRQITSAEGLISDGLSTVFQDREHNLWLAGRRGVVQVLPPLFEFIDTRSGTPFEMVYSFAIDEQGNYWVCSEAGLYKGVHGRYGLLEWTNVSQHAGLTGINFISVHISSSGDIWTGTYGSGVYRLNASGAVLGHITYQDGLLDNNVINISGNKDHIWFSTLGGGVSCYVTAQERILNFDNQALNQSYIYAAKEDKMGKTWIAGSLSAPAYIEDNRFQFIAERDSVFPQLYGIAIDSSGNAWFNANENGLLYIGRDTMIRYNDQHGIDFTEIQSIVFDKWNNLVVISNQGIKFFKPSEGVLMEFNDNAGVAYKYPILNAVYKHTDGQIWIGTETGIIKYNPDYLQQVDNKPRIFLSTVNLFGQPLETEKWRFKYNENNFTFGYTGLWFKNPDGLTYRYILDGYDLEWTYSKRNQPFTYSKLPAGKYTFIAQVSLDGKSWIDSPDSVFEFTVLLPFWKKWWFISLLFVLLVAGIYYYIRKRLSNLQKAKEELEREVSKRTEEIRAQNDELEQQKEEIAAQRDLAEMQRDQIDHQNQEIQASIRYALRIQSAALPPAGSMEEILGDHFVLNKPRDIVSGDFYWVSKREDNIFFSVADCTGHGVPGAFMSMLGLASLNEIVKTLDICKPSEVLDLLNKKIVESLHQAAEHGTKSTDGMDISLCIYEPATGLLQFSAAYNDLYLIREGEMKIVKADRMGIGSDAKKQEKFTNNEIQARSGDIVYLFSDGFPDQFGGPKGKKYKYVHFREFLLKIHKEDMQRQRELLDKEIETWRSDMPQIDDIMVMGVRL